MKNRLIALLIALALTLSCLGSVLGEAALALELPRSEARLALEAYLEADPALMALMEKSIALAHEINPDPETNPIDSVEALYDYIDWMTVCMPWNVLTDAEYPTLYQSIDQSIDYFWFLVDQPLEELEGLGYYYPTLQYHEPISSWLYQYSEEWGAFLSTEESWNDLYYQRVKTDPSMNMQYGWYAEENVWTPSTSGLRGSSLTHPCGPSRRALWCPRWTPSLRACGPSTRTATSSMRRAWPSSPPASLPSRSSWGRIPPMRTPSGAVR